MSAVNAMLWDVSCNCTALMTAIAQHYCCKITWKYNVVDSSLQQDIVSQFSSCSALTSIPIIQFKIASARKFKHIYFKQ